jgi:hypothetical protein
MLDRCYLKTSDRYPTYGGQGIEVCNTWRNSYIAFRNWARQAGYQDGLSIERIDNDGDYCPENCTWVPPGRQMRNMQRTVWVTAWGETKALPDWIDDPRCKAKYTTVYMRLRKGWDPEDAFTM